VNLPNYFLADLSQDATLSPAIIVEACRTLKRNRDHYLAGRSTQHLVEILSEVAANWLRPGYPFRQLAIEHGPGMTGFSRATLSNGLDAFFSRLTPEEFQALLLQDLGHAKRLDQVVWDTGHSTRGSAPAGAVAVGPELLVHVAAGDIPNPTLTGIVLGVLIRSAQFVKCPSGPGAGFLPRLFAHSLYDADPKLGACLEIAGWRGGNEELERALFDQADCITANGRDETLVDIRRRLPPRVKFLGYGHRVSFGYIADKSLSGFRAQNIAAQAAADVVAWNQLGCLSPHVFYVAQGAGIAAEHFAHMLAEELERCEQTEPRGDLPPETAAAIASRRAIYEVRAAHSPDTRFWQSQNSTAWTVVFESDPRFQLSCLNRFIYVKGVPDLKAALESADSVRDHVSTVGLAAPEERTGEIAAQLARWGVTRVCPLGEMQRPHLTWRHDGRPGLGDLVTWTDVGS
jgi:hypothetical protein